MLKNKLENFKSREIRIFISSTFRDMMKEREYLVKKIFPQLRKKFKENAVTIVEVDLRWGVLEEEAKGGKVIDICLSEVDKSRPYFIGLVGERYGWIPNELEYKKHEQIIEKFGWIKNDIAEQLSITEMEIQYGVLRNEKMWERSFFYLRDPENDESKNYKESENSDEYAKLKNLKKKIIANTSISSTDYSNLEEFGEMVFKDLSKVIAEDFPPISEQDQDVIPQLDLISKLTKIYIPDEKLIDKIKSVIAQNDKPIVITGKYGLGKSALLAHLTVNSTDKFDYIFYNFSNTNAASRNPVKLLKRFAAEIPIDTADFSDGNLVSDFESNAELLLDNIENSRKTFLIIIDDLESIRLNLSVSFINLLCYFASFENICVIVSTENETIKKRLQWQESKFIKFYCWLETNQKNFISNYLGLYSKKLMSQQIDFITKINITELPLLMKSFLNELIRYGEYETLDSQIDKFAKSQTEKEFYGIIITELEKEFIESKSDLEIILAATALTRYGILELDLFELCNTSRMNFNYILNSVLPELDVIEGRYRIQNKYLLEAIYERYLFNQEKIDAVVNQIVKVISERGKTIGNLVNEDTNDIGYLLSISEDQETITEYLSEMNMVWWLYHEDIHLLMKIWFKVLNLINPVEIYTTETITNFFNEMNGGEENRFQNFLGLRNFAHILEVLNCYDGAKNIYKYLLEYIVQPLDTDIDIQSVKVRIEYSLVNTLIKIWDFDSAEENLLKIFVDYSIDQIESFPIKLFFLSQIAEVYILKQEPEKAVKFLEEVDSIFESNPNLVEGDIDESVLKAISVKMKHFESMENYEIAEELSAFLIEKVYTDKGEYSIEYLESLIENAKFQTLNEKIEDGISTFCEAEITAGELFGTNNNPFIEKISKLTKTLRI